MPFRELFRVLDRYKRLLWFSMALNVLSAVLWWYRLYYEERYYRPLPCPETYTTIACYGSTITSP